MHQKLLILKYYLKYKYFSKFKSRAQLEKYQNKEINKHLKFVLKRSKFYKQFYKGLDPDNLQNLPLTNKEIMMKNFNDFNTLGIDREEAFNIAISSEESRNFTKKLKGITIGLSSGTSGHRGIFAVSDFEKNMWAGVILAKLLPHGILKRCRIAFFLRADSNLYQSVKSKNIRFEYFDMLTPVESHVERLNQFMPDVLTAPPQVLIQLAELKSKELINIAPEKIISVAEVLEEADEKLIKKAFNKEIIHQVYQCTEGFLAHSCEYGTMHMNEDLIKIEKEYIDEARFIPIITDFTRTTQPIIRYRLNDILVEKKEPCKCGSMFTAFEKIEGREDDSFLFESRDGKKVVTVYPDFIRRCVLFTEGVSKYRVVQDKINKIEIQLDDSSSSLKENIKNEFMKLSELMGFTLPEICFGSITVDSNKKLRRVERRFKL